MLRQIVYGHVVQVYDPALRRFTAQAFFATDDRDYEDEQGNPVDETKFAPFSVSTAIARFEMVQPDESPPAADESAAHPAPTMTRSMMQRAIQIRPPVENLGVPETMVRELVQERAALLIEVAQRCPELLPPDLWLRVQRAVGM